MNGNQPFDDTATGVIGPPPVPTSATSTPKKDDSSASTQGRSDKSAMVAAFQAGCRLQTPDSITAALVFMVNKIIGECCPSFKQREQQLPSPTIDDTGDKVDESARSIVQLRSLFCQYVGGLVFPHVYDKCLQSLNFAYVPELQMKNTVC